MFTQQQAIDTYMISQLIGGIVALVLMAIGIYAAFNKENDK